MAVTTIRRPPTSASTDAPDATGDTGDVPEDWPDEIVFTLTPSQETGGLIETAEPLAELLSAELGVDVTPLVPTDYSGVIVALESGQAQVAGGLGPRQMVQAEEQADAELILQAERFGSLLYVTQWFTNDPDTYCDDEPVADEDGYLFCNGVLDASGPEAGPIGADKLALLEGQTVSFVDQGSTSGYAIPALQLSEAGIDPIDGIDGLFAGGHDGSVQAVYDGDAVVGVSYNDARGDIVETSPDVGEKVVVFGWSGPIPNDGFAVASDLPDSLVEAITAAFVVHLRHRRRSCTPVGAVQHRRPRAGHVERLRRDPRSRDRSSATSSSDHTAPGVPVVFATTGTPVGASMRG